MATLVIVCGPPFSGKTTLAGRWAAETGGVVVSYDALWHEMKQKTGREWSFEELSALAEERLLAALNAGRDALFDTLNDTRDWRDRLRALWPDTQLLYLDVSADVLRTRLEENRQNPTRHDISDDAFEAALQKFEPPTPDENPTVHRRGGAFRGAGRA